MGLIDTLRALRVISKASKFIKSNEDKVLRARKLYEEVCEAAEILNGKREIIEQYLCKVREILLSLKRNCS